MIKIEKEGGKIIKDGQKSRFTTRTEIQTLRPPDPESDVRTAGPRHLLVADKPSLSATTERRPLAENREVFIDKLLTLIWGVIQISTNVDYYSLRPAIF